MSEKSYPMEKIVTIINELFKNGKEAVITVTGNSMAPLFYHKRSRVTLVPCSGNSIKKYDIILYKRTSGEYVLHRVVNVRSTSIDCCGDSETQIEKGVKKTAVIGRVTEFYRKRKIMSTNNIIYKIYSVLWVALLKKRKTIMKLNKKLRG